MKKAILVITLTLIVLVIAGSTIGCTGKTTTTSNPTTPTAATNTTTSTPTLTASAGANGTIDPTGTIPVNYGATQSFTFTPAANYHVANVLVDTVSVGAPASYKFTNVTAVHTISVTFDTNTTTVSQSMNLIGTWSGTHIIMSSSPNKYNDKVTYNLVITIKGQYIGNQIVAQFTAKGISYYRDGVLQPSAGAYAWPRLGDISGGTVTWKTIGDDKTPGESLQVSGNSMTGKGKYTDMNGTTNSWSYNLTRVH